MKQWNPNKINLPYQSAKLFAEVIARQMPWMRLGAISFIGREDYYDFHYEGNGRFPVGITSTLETANWGIQSRTERLESFKEKFDEQTVNWLARVTFHEMGHAISLAMRGFPEKSALRDYGFETRSVYFSQAKSGLRAGLRNEVEAFAVQHRLHQLLGFDDRRETTLKAMLKLIDRDEWRGVMSIADKRRFYREMYDYTTPETINQALDVINEVLV